MSRVPRGNTEQMQSVLATRPGRTLALSAAVFAGLVAAILLSEDVDRLDIRFVRFAQRETPDWLVDALRVLTYAGSAIVLGVVALVAATVLARRGRSRDAAFVIAASVAGLLVTQILKAAIRRARPELDAPLVQLATYSFPSGHVLAATATYGALAIVLYPWIRSRSGRIRVTVAVAALILLVAASRVVLGVHYLLDVTAGVVGGIALLSALLLVFERVPLRAGRLRRHEQAQRPGIDT